MRAIAIACCCPAINASRASDLALDFVTHPVSTIATTPITTPIQLCLIVLVVVVVLVIDPPSPPPQVFGPLNKLTANPSYSPGLFRIFPNSPSTGSISIRSDVLGAAAWRVGAVRFSGLIGLVAGLMGGDVPGVISISSGSPSGASALWPGMDQLPRLSSQPR